MLSIQLIAEDLQEWSEKTFGTSEERGPIGPLKHLQKEVEEALEAPDDASEYADCLILIIDAARRAGFDIDELLHATHCKMKINRHRKWAKPTSDEPIFHESE